MQDFTNEDWTNDTVLGHCRGDAAAAAAAAVVGGVVVHSKMDATDKY